jgi:flagellar hook-associated protein 3 FlgL
MRVNPNLVPNILADLQQSQAALNVALQEVSTGKSVSVPSDNPSASASMVQNTIETGNVDQYTQNVSSMLSMVQTADSALSNVVSSLTQAVSLGTQGANGTNSSSNLQAIAQQVKGILESVVAQANTSYGGTYLFAGTASQSKPFSANASSASGYSYNGNSDVNTVAVGDNMGVQVNLPGNEIFSNPSTDVLGSLSSLISALQSGNTSAIETATSGITSALNYIGRERVFYANVETRLNSEQMHLQNETVTLSSQESRLVGVDMAKAATQLAQAQTANSAALAAAAKVLPTTLLNYLSPPQ